MNKWKSAGELNEEMKATDKHEQLSFLYGLSLFCDRAFFKTGFEVDPRWSQVIALTEQANEYAKSMQRAGVPFDENSKHFIFFQLFFHNELFIDHHSTDPEAVLGLLSEMHASNQVQWPYVFGNKLYHKFNDAPHATQTDHLEPEQAATLLDGTPQGVFQIGNLVSGPLGFIRGREERMLPPTLDVLLWHCSDPGCRALHLVELRQFNSPFQVGYNDAWRHIVDNFGPPSEWYMPLLYTPRIDKWPNGRPFADIPAVIGDCIVGAERTAVVSRALRSEHNGLLTTVARNAGRDAGRPDEVANSFTPEEQHQLLLLLPDEAIVSYLDELIACREISIPPSESRAKKTYSYGLSRDTSSQLTNLGIRSRAHPPVVELADSIWSSYNALNQTDDLRWRLRKYEAPTPRHSVLEHIRSQGPQLAVRDLILPSRAVTTAVSERARFSMIEGENEDHLINRLLWKLGFNLARYEDTHQILRNRIEEFKSCVLQLGAELSENEKAAVRSSGVNLFVSVEIFLEELVSYNAWLLSSDHFTDSNFRYTAEAASKAVLETLGASIESGTETFRWSIEGDNTLGSLLAYFQAYRAWLKERPDVNRTPLKRPQDDYPHYAKDTVFTFPFQHTELWVDIPVEMFTAYTEIIGQVGTQLAQADLPLIRNGLDHKRPVDAFPASDQMLACVSRLREAVELADRYRLVPKLYWGVRSESDNHGNICDTFKDYRGNSVALWGPPLVMAGQRKSFGVPYLVAPLDLLNLPNTMLIFTITSKSPYSEYWKDYPRRRFIPPKEELSARDLKVSYDAEDN